MLENVRTGGHGIAWDGPFNKELRRLVQETYATNKIIAAVDHGPAAIVHAKNIKLGDPNEGMPLIFHKDVRTLSNGQCMDLLLAVFTCQLYALASTARQKELCCVSCSC